MHGSPSKNGEKTGTQVGRAGTQGRPSTKGACVCSCGYDPTPGQGNSTAAYATFRIDLWDELYQASVQPGHELPPQVALLIGITLVRFATL